MPEEVIAPAPKGTILNGDFLGVKVLRSKSDPTRTFGIARIDDGETTHEVLVDPDRVASYYDKLEVGDSVRIPIRVNARNDNRGAAQVSIAEVTARK